MAQEGTAVLPRVRSLLGSPYYWPDADANFHQALERLAASLDMVPVWEGLSGESPAPYLPELFLDACMVALMEWSRISKTPTRIIESDLAQIENTARRLASLLRTHEADLSLRNIPTTVASLIRKQAQLAGQSGVFSEESVIKAIPESVRSRSDSAASGSESGGAIDGTFDIPLEHILELLAQDLKRPGTTDLEIIRPTRINASSAERTFYSRALTHFFLTHGGNPRFEWVARSVTALLDLKDPLDATHARHLFEDIQHHVWDSADDYRPSVDDPSST